MEKEEKIKRIDVLQKEINIRQEEIDRLNKELMESGTFHEKFVIWANEGKATQLSHLPDGAVRAFIDDRGWLDGGRGVIHMLHDEDFVFYADSNYEKYYDSKEEADKEFEKLEADVLFMAACEHMIQDNFDSFEMDW